MENKLKHLEFIQNTINRLSNNSFILKGWSITLTAALFILLEKDHSIKFVIIVYFPLIAFWFLDTYFLWQERLFRVLYEKVREIPEDKIDFSMRVDIPSKGKNTYHETFTSCTLSCFYIPLVLVMSIVILLN